MSQTVTATAPVAVAEETTAVVVNAAPSTGCVRHPSRYAGDGSCTACGDPWSDEYLDDAIVWVTPSAVA